MIADIDRQVIEYRAFGDALQSFDANVADGEAIRRGLRMQVNHGSGWMASATSPSSRNSKPHATGTA